MLTNEDWDLIAKIRRLRDEPESIIAVSKTKLNTLIENFFDTKNDLEKRLEDQGKTISRQMRMIQDLETIAKVSKRYSADDNPKIDDVLTLARYLADSRKDARINYNFYENMIDITVDPIIAEEVSNDKE